MKKKYVLIILLLVLIVSIVVIVRSNKKIDVEDLSTKEIEKLNSIIERNFDKGSDIQPMNACVSWAQEGIIQIKTMLNKLIPTLKVKGQLTSESFNSRHYTRCSYNNMILLIKDTSKQPENEIIGIINNKYYLLEGGIEETNSIVVWMKKQGFSKSFSEELIDLVLSLFR